MILDVKPDLVLPLLDYCFATASGKPCIYLLIPGYHLEVELQGFIITTESLTSRDESAY